MTLQYVASRNQAAHLSNPPAENLARVNKSAGQASSELSTCDDRADAPEICVGRRADNSDFTSDNMLTVYAFPRVASVVQGHGGSLRMMDAFKAVSRERLVSAIGNPDEDILFFDLERIESLLAVFEATCRSLQVTSKDDPLAEIIATKVAEASATGERDPDRLRDLVLLTLRNA